MMKKINEMRELQKKKGKKGFSMIELIIVIAIMAILIALIGTQLIPYLEKSRQSKDMTTLDTCLTQFQTALADAEVPVPKNKSCSGITSLDDFGTGVKAAYEEIAGAYGNDTSLTDSFKSKEAKGGTVTFGVDSNGICYVEVKGTGAEKGGLKVSSSDSGVQSS